MVTFLTQRFQGSEQIVKFSIFSSFLSFPSLSHLGAIQEQVPRIWYTRDGAEQSVDGPLGRNVSKTIFMVCLNPAAHLRPVSYTFSRMLTLTFRPAVVSVLDM